MATPPFAAALDAPDLAREYAQYPCTDGEPMAENMWQAWAIVTAAVDLKKARPDALVAPDIFVYPECGNKENCVAPDLLAAWGVGTHYRKTYLLWREGKPPDWVLEVASSSTVWRDLTAKRGIYAAMGVPEYWLFDPQGDLFPQGEPRLQGLSLSGGRYRSIPTRIEGGERVIRSEVLKLDLRVDDKLIRFHDPATGQDIPHPPETEAAREREAARADAEAVRADNEAALRHAAEGRVAEADARAAKEATRADAEAARANTEAAQRATAEARVAEMAAIIERLRSGQGDAQ